MALEPPLTLPYIFVPGTIIDAGQMNADLSVLLGGVNNGTRNMLTAPTTFYVAPGGVDAPGNGLSSTSPAATVTFVVNMLLSGYDLNRQRATIQLANGSYTENVQWAEQLIGQTTPNQLVIQGNMTSPGLVTLTGNPCFQIFNGALAQIQGMTLESPAGSCITTNRAAALWFQNVLFGTAANDHVFCNDTSNVEAIGNYTISGGAQRHVVAQNLSDIHLPAVLVTLDGTPAFSQFFAVAAYLGFLNITATFSGGATGTRSLATMNGVININGAGPNYLPGDAAGTTDTGGQTG